MNTQSFTLLVAILLFGLFSGYFNVKASSHFLKALTFVCIFLSIGLAFAVIIKSFVYGG